MKHYDYIIVGSGIAGLYSALLARENGSVLILTKGSIEECNTKHAQGGIAAAVGKHDSPQLHFQDTIAAGAGLCDTETVRTLVEEAPDRISDLIKLGVPFDTLDGEIALTQEAAHSTPRILHAGGDATGEHIETTLSRHVRLSRIKVLEYCLVTSITVEDNAVRGVEVLDCRTSSIEEFGCHFLIMVTGGAGRLFKLTTNSEVATGDGVSLAYEAGVEIVDMEFFQFHPTVLRLPGVIPFLISEAMRGEGGILRNVEGERFMLKYTPEGELAPRDVVTRGILNEMKRTRSDKVFLDVTHLSPRLVTTRFPHIYRFCLDCGLDITKDLVPVAPAAHYMMGGVMTSNWGETNIACLFAAGETACTGVHGANRLASNSLLETVVFAKRIVQRTEDSGKSSAQAPMRESGFYCSLGQRDKPKTIPPLSLSNLQSLLWEKVGIERSGEALKEAADILAAWEEKLPQPTDRPSYELSDMVTTSRLMTEAALIREESRGAHFRTDFPHSSPTWLRHIIFKKG